MIGGWHLAEAVLLPFITAATWAWSVRASWRGRHGPLVLWSATMIVFTFVTLEMNGWWVRAVTIPAAALNGGYLVAIITNRPRRARRSRESQ